MNDLVATLIDLLLVDSGYTLLKPRQTESTFILKPKADGKHTRESRMRVERDGKIYTITVGEEKE